ncbi:unnamed protein product, partial [Urochloa humidicola]
RDPSEGDTVAASPSPPDPHPPVRGRLLPRSGADCTRWSQLLVAHSPFQRLPSQRRRGVWPLPAAGVWRRDLGSGEGAASAIVGIQWSLENKEIFPSRMVGDASALRYSAMLCSPILHSDGGLQTEGPPHRRVPNELDLRDHDIVSTAKIYAREFTKSRPH